MGKIPRHLRKEYETYIRSSEWKKKRLDFIEMAHNPDENRTNGDELRVYRCEGTCGYNWRSDELDVHHKHYLTIGRETKKDVLVVCKNCHKELDIIRARQGKERAESALHDAQYEGWLRKRYGNDSDLNNYDSEEEYEAFEQFLEKQEDNW